METPLSIPLSKMLSDAGLEGTTKIEYSAKRNSMLVEYRDREDDLYAQFEIGDVAVCRLGKSRLAQMIVNGIREEQKHVKFSEIVLDKLARGAL